MIPRKLVLVVLLSGCGEDYCSRSARASEACGEEVTPEDRDACRDSIEGCSIDDQQLMIDTLDCLDENGVTTCGASTGGTVDLAVVVECVIPLANLTPQCEANPAYTQPVGPDP